ncbi:MAG: glycosyltransferase family 9 protein [Ignavibacteria bacterium]|nr:glycosyltransferase family 9 protein [Ignavibacteria bacterium]
MRILINALSGIGDAIMFSPALAVLKKHLPEAKIDMLVMYRQVEDIYRNNPNVNNVYFIDFMKQSKIKSLKEVLVLRKNRYDASINVYPSNRKEYNLVQFMLGAKKRIAIRYNHVSRANLDFLNTTLKKEELNRHNVLENFDLVKTLISDAAEEELGPFIVNFSIEDKTNARKHLIDAGLMNNFLVGFHAGSATLKGHIHKRWAAEKYAELAKVLYNKYDARVILFGTENDVNSRIHEATKDFSYIPPANGIMESLALMQRCNFFVSNDTALMHLAAGLKIPQVAIFGYTNYKELYPWQNKHVSVRKELACSPCFYNSPKPVHCIFTGEEEFKCKTTISVQEVFEACCGLIEEIPRNVKS